MLLEIARPFSYLTIRHPDLRVQVVNWLVPALAATVFVALWFKAGTLANTFGAAGLLDKVIGFVQNLPGFYLAALAAVATFNNVGMDKLMPGVPPTAKVLHNNTLTRVQLTRRRMLSIMFAFLTAESFLLTIVGIGATTFAMALKSAISTDYHQAARVIFIWAYALFLAQMTCVTLWGLFYLGERVHTPD